MREGILNTTLKFSWRVKQHTIQMMPNYAKLLEQKIVYIYDHLLVVKRRKDFSKLAGIARLEKVGITTLRL